jgi:hypothetical protein
MSEVEDEDLVGLLRKYEAGLMSREEVRRLLLGGPDD